MAGTERHHDDFLALVRPLDRAIASVATAYGRSPADRQDLAQEVLAQLWRSFDRYDRSRPFSTWVYRIALNVAISHARARWRAEDASEPIDAEAHPAPAAEPVDERLALLRRFVGELEPMSRALMVLYLDERSGREMAEILGITETNVTTRLARIRQRLRERFAQAGGSDGAR